MPPIPSIPGTRPGGGIWIPQGNRELLEILEQLAQTQEVSYRTGDFKFTARGLVDQGFLTCEGQAVSRVTFAALFAVIGVKYGAGDGVTTFNVPDYRERIAMGSGGARSLAERLGEALVKLVTGQLPSHAHGSPPGSTGFIAQGLGNVPGGNGFNWGVSTQTAETGAGEAHNNIQPSLVCNVWIKT